MEKERIVRLRVLHKPVHRPQNILLRRLADGILLVVGEYHHVLPLIPKVRHQVPRHVAHVVDASPQLAPLAKVVDADQESLAHARTHRVLILVARRRPVAELARVGRRGRRGAGARG